MLSRPDRYSFCLLSDMFPSDKVRGVRKCIDYQPLTNHLRQVHSALAAMTLLPVVTVTCQQRLTPGILRAQSWEIIRPDSPLGLNQGCKSSFQSSVKGVRGQNQPMIWPPHRCHDPIAWWEDRQRQIGLSEWHSPLRRVMHSNHNKSQPVPHWNFHHPVVIKSWRSEHACNYFTERGMCLGCTRYNR